MVTELLRLDTGFKPSAQASVREVLALLLLDPKLGDEDRRLLEALLFQSASPGEVRS